MSHRTQLHHEARLQRAMADLRQLARDRGLEHAYAMELFDLEQQVRDAVSAHASALADDATAALRQMARRLRTTPRKDSGDHVGRRVPAPEP